jgi:putative Mg2+ transporter-C (MgtC) family protein
MLSHVALVIRITTGGLLGGVIGYERDRHGRPVGLRTHLLVALASATFMVVSSHFVYFQGYGKDDLVEVDASRIAASVVSGIGFLAGGAILRTGLTVQGLTTAAGLWLVTAIGLCAGAGMYVEAVVVTALGVVSLTVLRRFEDKNDQLVRKRVSVVLGTDVSVPRVAAIFTDLGGIVSDIEYDKRLDKSRLEVAFDVRVPATLSSGDIIAKLEERADVRRVHIQHPQ